MCLLVAHTVTYGVMEVHVFTHEDRHELGRGVGKGTQTFGVHGQ
jgi:hypothetical protein